MTFRVGGVLVFAISLGLLGCEYAPGRPGPGPQVLRPDQQLDFETLYKANCAGCHGANGDHGPAIALSNPVYLGVAGEDKLRDITAKGVHGTLMPAFAKGSGGTLSDQQVAVIARGIMQAWDKPTSLTGQTPPPYSSTLTGDVAQGQRQFMASCASCHGKSGTGTQKSNGEKIGSIVDPSYLALVSDQAIRSFVIAGSPGQGMPDWRSDSATPMTDQQVTDIVAWMASQRGPSAGQPYPIKRREVGQE